MAGASAASALRCGDRCFDIGRRTVVMGIVNVTPDSFSDGGHHLDAADAYDHAMRLLEDGADVVDVGAESTRPGATPVAASEELRRLVPVLQRLADAGVRCVSVDTYKADVARAALDLGAAWINDTSALADPEMITVARGADALVVMHQRPMRAGRPGDDVVYEDVVAEVRRHLLAVVAGAVEQGMSRDRIIIDPGIGFGKSVDDNVRLLERVGDLSDIAPVLVGPSRKRFLAAITASDDIADRDAATVGACCLAATSGASIVRVHSVRQVRHALDVIDAARCGRVSEGPVRSDAD